MTSLMIGAQNPLASEKNPELVFNVNNAFPGVDLNIEQVISVSGVFAVYPVADKKNKVRPCYVVLRNCICELHKSQKDVDNCRPASHCIDLRLVFNVCIVKEAISIKSDCLCVMTPTETYFIGFEKQQLELQTFYEDFLERARETRSTMLVRPVYRDEYFEASWDVNVIKRPKLQKEFPNTEIFPDITLKNPTMLGHRRLCMRSTSMVVFKTGIRASSDINNPYTRDCFFDFPINMISTYGKQERYFFMQIGQCSEWGKSEVWFQCETSNSAKVMHERIDEINQREADKRREQGVVLSYPGISQRRMMRSRGHRERSHTLNQDFNGHDEPQTPTNGHHTRRQEERKSAKQLTSKSKEDMTDSDQQEKKKQGFFSSIRRGKEAKKEVKESPKLEKRAGFTSLFRFGKDKEKKVKKEEEQFETEPFVEKEPADNQQPEKDSNTQNEDYVAYDHRIDSHKTSEIVTPFRQISVTSSSATSDKRKQQHIPKDYVEMDNNLADKSIVKKEYVYPFAEARAYISDNGQDDHPQSRSPMSETSPSTSRLITNLESRAYSLGSKPIMAAGRRGPLLPTNLLLHQPEDESATGSLNTVGSIVEEEDFPRNEFQPSTSADAFTKSFPNKMLNEKFSSKTSPLHQPHLLTVQQQKTMDDELIDEDEKDVPTDLIDIRKRAHSLGSRSWIKSAALRKLTNKLQGGPQPRTVTSPSSAHNTSQGSVIGIESTEDERSRAGSTGSQTSWNVGQRRNPTHFGDDEEDELMEIDFDTNSKTDSPLNRSRNSSLGMKTPIEIKTALDRALEEKQKQQAIAAKERERKKRDQPSNEKSKVENETLNEQKQTNFTQKYNEENDYVQFNPVSSPSTNKKQVKIESNGDTQPTKKHKGNCRRRNRSSSNNSPNERQLKTPDLSPRLTAKQPEHSPKRDRSASSVNSTSSGDRVLARHGSSDSLELFERGEGMIVISDKPLTDNLMTKRLMRPISKSIGASNLLHTHRQRSATNFSSTAKQSPVHKKRSAVSSSADGGSSQLHSTPSKHADSNQKTAVNTNSNS